VTDSCLNSFDAEPVPEIKKPRRTVGNKSPRLVVEARQQRLYRRQLEGLPARQLVLDHASKEGVSEATGWSDWKQVNSWNNEDWQKDRENMLARLQAARLRLYEKAIRKGQLQTAAQVLDSIGKVIGESVEHVSIQAPELSIRVESKQDLS
tara:strand:+ start:164 stop:616 length:453 start_codon:yes stop_codon:yes gene_type:complete